MIAAKSAHQGGRMSCTLPKTGKNCCRHPQRSPQKTTEGGPETVPELREPASGDRCFAGQRRGAGPLMKYDTALRIGANLGVRPLSRVSAQRHKNRSPGPRVLGWGVVYRPQQPSECVSSAEVTRTRRLPLHLQSPPTIARSATLRSLSRWPVRRAQPFIPCAFRR